MPTDASGGAGLAVVAGDVLALRGTGLAAAETWALLCQAAQALQDLFLSNGGVVGGSRAGPVVTPHTLELTPRGRVFLQLAPPETARAYLPPEYRPGRVYSDTESEKMWMYSLGRALLDTTPRVAALTGTVSVSPSSALQSVLAAMTEPDPRRRASLMNLLDVISEYCRTRLQSKPFTHIVMDMYREVVRSPQYAARKRAAYHRLNALPTLCNPVERPHQNYQGQNDHHHHHHHHQRQVHQHRQDERTQNGLIDQVNYSQVQRSSDQFHQQQQETMNQQNQVNQLFPKTQQQQQHVHHHHNHHNHHNQKGALFKAQSRNSRSHPNLTSLCSQQQQHQDQQQQQQQKRTDMALSNCRPQFQSQLDIQTSCRPSVAIPSNNHHHIHYQQQQQQQQQQHAHHHARAYSQPVPTRLQQTKSSGNLPTIVSECAPTGNLYNDPIYALPVKPFLSSQDVRVNGFSAKAPTLARRNDNVYASNTTNRRASNGGYSQPEDIYVRTNPSLQRQHSNPQLSSRDHQQQQQQQQQQHGEFKRLSQPSIVMSDHRIPRNEEQMVQQQNQLSSIRVRGAQGPPKPPRIITTLKKTPLSDIESNQSEPPAKPPRNIVRNGPRARRGKAVQRAPSRLYRTIGGPMRSFNKAQCVGPEFVVRANQPPKTLCVGQVKSGTSSRIVVIMLTGQRVEVTCDPQKITAGDLFQAIVQAENLEENFTLGLAVLLAGDFAILPPETKLNKVAPPGWLNSGKSKGSLGLPTSFMLYLRLRFFLPSLRGIRNWISKHLLYLQIRRCILEQQLVCSYPELIYLTGLALQVEFGNYNANEHGCGDYFLLEHYVPESLILNVNQHQSHVNAEALRVQLQQAHRDRRGLDSNKAEEMFITHAQSLPDYGSHYYIASVDSKELEKVMAQQKKKKATEDEREACVGARTENIYGRKKSTYGRIENLPRDSCENIPKIGYNDERAADGGNPNKHFNGNKGEQITQIQTTCRLSRKDTCANNNNNNNNVNNNSKNKASKSKKTDSNVWLAIHAQGLKLFERGGEPRERTELAHFQWRDIQTLSYSKNCLVVYTKLNGKRCKFKLRMDHRKSYFAFKLTSLHHQFFLKLRSELTSLQGLAKDFGVPLTVETAVSPSKIKNAEGKTKITIANTVKTHQKSSYPMQLEEYQNKENENPQKDTNAIAQTQDNLAFYSSEEDALYAQVNIRLEPEGESRDTEDESEGDLINPNEPVSLDLKERERNAIYGCTRIKPDTECAYALPKIMSTNDIDHLNDKPDNPEELYAAINKAGLSRKKQFPVPEEVWEVADVKKTIHKMKTSSLPNYGTPRQSAGFRTPSLPRRLGVKMGTRAIYSSLVQKDAALADDAESMSLKSDTESSIRSFSARSTESPLPEAYVLNADIRTDDETFRVPEEESMSVSLMARLEELSFADERILHTIKLERGHGGSIGLQVTEGNDGGVYVQAVSVGGSADMAGNVNKGDRIVAINGQNLLNLRYEDALKMLQSSSETVELVLSQPDSRKKVENRDPGVTENNYLHDIRFDVSSEAETSSMTNKWLAQKTTDVASVQNTSSAYSSAASSAMGEPPPPPPPVPPRRRRRKIVNNLDTPREVGNTNCTKRVDRKRLPPPPPPSQIPRRNKAKLLQENQIQTRITVHVLSSKDEKDESNEIVRSADSKDTNLDRPELGNVNQKSEEVIVGEKDDELFVLSPKYDRIVKREGLADSINVNPDNSCLKNIDKRSEELTIHENNDELFVRSPRYDRLVRKEEFNKYPSLFFTLDDIQNVIPDKFPGDEKLDDPKMESEEMENKEMEKEEMENSLERDQIEVCHETKESFINNCIEDENDVCFRVTPTNFPFEKCLDRWKTSMEGDDFGIDERNNFIFEDYMDRSNALNVRRSKSPMCYDVFDSDETTVEHTATKVRFVIESPSSSTPDIDIQDSLQNVDSIQNEEADEQENHVESNSNQNDLMSNNADIFGEIPFGSVIESNVTHESHEICPNSPVKGVENNEEEVEVNFPDSSVLSPVENRFPKEQVPTNTKEERCSQAQELSPEYEVSKTVDRVNENLVFPEDLNESSNSRKQFNTSERRKIFVTQSLRSFIEDSPVDWEDNESQDGELVEEDYSDKLEIKDKNFSNVTITREEELESESCSHVSNFVEPIEKCSILTGKEIEVPVSVRRNSFLEQMLSDDSTDKTWNLRYCEIVATHPKNDRLTLIEEKNEKDSSNNPINTKNVVDVKTEVLNELLSNFATIKLKNVFKPDEIAVNPTDDKTIDETINEINDKDTNRITTNEIAVQRIQAEINVSQKMDEDMKNSKILETDSQDSKHSDDQVKVAGITSDVTNETVNTNLDDLVTISLKNLNESIEHEGKTDSAAKCAIVREKTPNVITHRNNDDNNRAVRTPVALSNDQSSGQEPSTIIPGSVRSFVKYYEIRRETTAVEDSKINDRRTLDQRSNLVKSNVGQDSMSNRIRRFECKEETKAARENTIIQTTPKDNKKELLMNPGSVSNEINYTMIVKKVVEPSGLKMECVKGSPESENSFDGCYSSLISESSIKSERKKSVQFSGGHTVIESHGVDVENAEEYLEDSFSQPGQHLAQEVHPRTDYERDSGINRFVSNAASNTRLVFYCTV